MGWQSGLTGARALSAARWAAALPPKRQAGQSQAAAERWWAMAGQQFAPPALAWLAEGVVSLRPWQRLWVFLPVRRPRLPAWQFRSRPHQARQSPRGCQVGNGGTVSQAELAA